MPRYFFNVHDGISVEDDEGHELADLEAAKREAVMLASELLRDHASTFWTGEQWRLDVTDEAGLILFFLCFEATLAPAIRKAVDGRPPAG